MIVIVGDMDGEVFPTCVGVNLLARGTSRDCSRIPHVCGGEPGIITANDVVIEYSPRVWG